MSDINDHVIWWMILVIFIIVGFIIFTNFVKWLFFPKKLSKKQQKKEKRDSFLGGKYIWKKDILSMNDYYKQNPDVYARNVKLFNLLGNIRSPFKYIYSKAKKIRKKDQSLILYKEKLVLCIDNYRNKNPIRLFKYLVVIFISISFIQPYFYFNKIVLVKSNTQIIFENDQNLYSLNNKLSINELPIIMVKNNDCDTAYRRNQLCEGIAYSSYAIRLYELYYKIYVFSNYNDVNIQAGTYYVKWSSNIDDIIQQIKNQSKLK